MCAQDATKNQDVSSKEDCAPNIDASNQSEKKLTLLCNPQNLPAPTLSQPTLPDMQTVTEDTRYAVRDFFADRVLKSKKKARERGWR